MAAHTSPRHGFDPQIISGLSDPSKFGFSGFEELFNVDGHEYVDDGCQSQASSASFSYNAQMGVPVTSSVTPMNQHSLAGSFGHPHHPGMWLDQNVWLDHDGPRKDSLVDHDAKLNDPSGFPGSHVDYSFLAGENNSLLGVDHTMIHHHQNISPPTTSHPVPYHMGTPVGQHSPATSQHSAQLWRKSQNDSPFYGHPGAWSSRPSHTSSRRPSMHSTTSHMSQRSPRHASTEIDEEGRERTPCPYPDCGKSFKDLKAHILTHQTERPEKCPISSCEFHKRGFARKYDRNRHLVTTHYKATIVCGFCPGSGSSSEKSFNRTDVFKRHLVAVHGVEQTPSNSKRRTPRSSARQSPNLPDDATGKCSTCGNVFATPQELFEHFDDCVLRVVTQRDPGEDANEKNLLSVARDGDVRATMERHSLLSGSGTSSSNTGTMDDIEYNSEEEEDTVFTPQAARSSVGPMHASERHTTGDSLHTVAGGHIVKHHNRRNPAGQASAGLTYSKGGVSLAAAQGRKKKKDYPQSWGSPMDKMKLKKRVLCVFDGQRRLWKDDMMLGDDFEVRMQLPNAEEGSYVTDLDVETLKRADAFHATTEEERGPWIPNNYTGDWSLVQQQLTA